MDQLSTQNILLGRERADSEAMCNKYLILKITIQKHIFSVSLPYTVRNCVYIHSNITVLSMTHSPNLTFRRLMSYIYMEHPFLMFLDHTQRRSTVGRTPLDE